MNKWPNIATVDNAQHTATLSGCSGLAAVSFGFSEAQNRTCWYNHPSEHMLRGSAVWPSLHPHYPPVTIRIPSQKRDVSLFHLMATDSVAFYRETTSHHDRSSMQCWLTHQSLVPNVAQLLLDFLLLPPVLHWQILPYEQMALRLRPYERLSHTLPISSNCLTLRQKASLHCAKRTENFRRCNTRTARG